ncbi:hypothetical protein CYK57_01141 [Actinobacillus pleuropneumoniae]|nr:hypothetical protein appser13_10500 [Actinobacillus pleuropneumoniae serovar 13 str. N273]QSZ39004.1 hypothetical protein CYK57_01141 [Actinobacillus pleuropneumoniae]
MLKQAQAIPFVPFSRPIFERGIYVRSNRSFRAAEGIRFAKLR